MKFALTLLLALGSVGSSFAQEILDEAEVEITTASEQDVKVLLARHGDATDDKNAMGIGEVLAAMSAHDNAEFLALALEGLTYKASKYDKREAKLQAVEFGEVSKKHIDGYVALREAEVQRSAAQLLANYPDEKKVPKALVKAFGDKRNRKDKPAVTAAVIGALGAIGYDKVQKDMLREVEQGKTKEVARAAVRYFGQIKCKDYKIVRKLCAKLSAPQPAAVDDASNPDASYWAAQWEVWSWTRRDVTWALKEITGQVFRPDEGEHTGDSRKAMEYVKKNKRELGLK